MIQRGDVEELLLSLTMVEVQHIGREAAPTIRTRFSLGSLEDCPEFLLVAQGSLDVCLSVSLVIFLVPCRVAGTTVTLPSPFFLRAKLACWLKLTTATTPSQLGN